ncbi:MAG: zinc ribbon domain-containing protein [Acidobacteriota bacterium]
MSKVLIACKSCQRRLDATGHPPGTVLRCVCSAEVILPPPHRDEAEVVRCSNCGGPRQEGAQRCPYCRADYTLHEQNLDTLCPVCFHRVSQSARYCHHCGIPTLRDQTTEITEHQCPACDEESWLRSRPLSSPNATSGEASPQASAASLSALECPHCAGLWLSAEAFRLLEERALQTTAPLPDLAQRKASTTLSGAPARGTANFGSGGRAYRPCIHCGRLMNRRNYGRGSSVVIDSCKEHGAWFDFEELAKILVWLRQGGAQRQRWKEGEMAREEERRRRSLAEVEVPRGMFSKADSGTNTMDVLGDFLDITSLIGSLTSSLFD